MRKDSLKKHIWRKISEVWMRRKNREEVWKRQYSGRCHTKTALVGTTSENGRH